MSLAPVCARRIASSRYALVDMSPVNVFYLMCSEYVYVSINEAPKWPTKEFVWFWSPTPHLAGMVYVALLPALNFVRLRRRPKALCEPGVRGLSDVTIVLHLHATVCVCCPSRALYQAGTSLEHCLSAVGWR